MNDLNAVLNEQEISELEDFLQSDQVPEACMDISMLDGLLTALLISPKPLSPGVWLPWVWDSESGKESVAFASEADESRITDLITRHMNAVAHTLLNHPEAFEPLFYENEQTYADGDPVLSADNWCIGFLRGVELNEVDWLPYLDEHGELLEPIALLGTEDGYDILMDMDDPEEELRLVTESVPLAVLEMYHHWQTHAAAGDGTPATLH